MRDFANHIHPVLAIAPAAAIAANAALVSAIVNIAGYEGCAFVILTGDLADADATFAVKLEHGDMPDLSDAAVVDDDHTTGTVAQAGFAFGDDNKLRKVGYTGARQYVRLTVTPANNAGNAFISALALLGHPRHLPTPNPPG